MIIKTKTIKHPCIETVPTPLLISFVLLFATALVEVEVAIKEYSSDNTSNGYNT
jgi:hypothetical protein